MSKTNAARVLPVLAIVLGAILIGSWYGSMAHLPHGTVAGALFGFAFGLPALRGYASGSDLRAGPLVLFGTLLVLLPTVVLVGMYLALPIAVAIGVVYAHTILASRRARIAPTLDAIDGALVMTALWLACLRFAVQAPPLFWSALAFSLVGLVVAVRRFHWLRRASLESANEELSNAPLVARYDGTVDGVIVDRVVLSNAPYRGDDVSVPIARAPADKRRALAPLARRIGLALLALVLAAVPAISQKHTVRERKGSLGFPSTCKRKGPIWLVHVGQGSESSIDMDALAKRFSEAYRTEVHVLPRMATLPEGYNVEREQWVAEDVLEQIRLQRGMVRSGVIIGILEDDMYMQKASWRFAYSARAQDRALISTARLAHGFGTTQLLEQKKALRLDVLIAKQLGVLYCDLPLSNNPKSVMYGNVMGPDDLDVMDESVWQ